jgi:hypothetical protein
MIFSLSCCHILLIQFLLLFSWVYGKDTQHSENGIPKYPLEMKIIEKAKRFFQQQVEQFDQRKYLLCATFMDTSKSQSRYLLEGNLRKTSQYCDWAIIHYNSEEGACEKPFFKNLIDTYPIVHCDYPAFLYRQTFNDMIKKREYHHHGNLTLRSSFIPKPLLYYELLPLLPNYQYVFVMDEDISISSIDLPSYLYIKDCSFYPAQPPLITQNLIAEHTQHYNYLYYKNWKRDQNHRKVLAIETLFIEQQALMLNSLFFQFFIQFVIDLTKEVVILTSSDWGTDSTWCGAAYDFAKEILQYEMSSFVPCAIITGTLPYHHNDGRTIRFQRTNRTEFVKNGDKMREYYHFLFPTWFNLGDNKGTNPLSLNNVLLKAETIDPECHRLPWNITLDVPFDIFESDTESRLDTKIIMTFVLIVIFLLLILVFIYVCFVAPTTSSFHFGHHLPCFQNNWFARDFSS